ncbi:hypothetical protein VroAM7_14630 [Vibrio rotiferianus]|uniref:Uncharacterized protein n=1 Tax=Vibrio rotiferianus TaxID=190895 RepID=A0A510I8X9_9VIBR|nr:hypothetical protein VroAM7_14630 [Vibrio rotiferianus]
MILATNIIIAMPYMPFLTNPATPEKIVSSKRRPFVIKIDIGIKLAGKIAIVAAIKYAHVF